MSLRTFIFTSLALIAASVLADPGTIDAYIKAQPAQSERIAKAIGAGGKVVSYNSRSGEARIRVQKEQVPTTKSKLMSLGLTVVKWEASPSGLYDPGSYSSVQKKAELEAAVRKKAGKVGAPGYLEARREWLKVRTFPYDRIDQDAIKKASDQAAMMPPYTGLEAGTRAITKWEYVGPKELTPPATGFYYGDKKLSGRVSCTAFDPSNSSVVYVGTGRGGLWKSVDGGTTWTILSKTWSSQNVNCILLTSPTTIYAGLGDFYGGSPYGAGIMKSIDSGATWQSIGSTTFGSLGVTCIQVVPNTLGQTLLATTSSPGVPGELFRSEDGGSNWVKVNFYLGLKNTWTDIAVTQTSGLGLIGIFLCGSAGDVFPLHRSFDGGKTWAQLTVPGVSTDNAAGLRIATSKVNPSRLYVLAPVIRKVLRSDDYGATWTDISAGMPDTTAKDKPSYNFSQAGYNNYLTISQIYAQSPNFPFNNQWFDVVYAGNIDISAYSIPWGGWKSAGGPTWTAIARTHNDQHAMAVDPKNPGRLLVGNDGGLFLATLNIAAINTPFAWNYTSLNSGLDTHLYYQAEVHPVYANSFIGGTQDNGVQCSVGNPNQWAVVAGGDGGYSHFDPSDTKKQISSTQNLSMFYTNDNWVTAVDMAPKIPADETIPFIGVTELDRFNSRYVYAGTNCFHMYDRQTNTWSYKRGTITTKGQWITAIESRSDISEVFVGTSDGKIWSTKERGIPWNDLTGNLPPRSVLGIGAPVGASKTLVAVLGNTSNNQVMVTYDYTVSSPVWYSVVGSGVGRLPNVTTNCIWVDPSDSAKRWWVGTDIGVFVTSNGGSTWLNATVPLGLPSVQVNKLEMSPGGYLHAITYGRGIWRFKPYQQHLTGMLFSPVVAKRGGSPVKVTVYWTQALDTPQVFNIETTTSITGLTVPTYINVPAGATSAFFLLWPANASGPGSVTIRVSEPTGSWISNSLQVQNPAPISLTLAPSEVRGTETVTGTLKLDSPAVAGQNVFAFTKTNLKTTATSFVIPAGSTTGTVTFGTDMPSNDIKGEVRVGTLISQVTIKRPRIVNLYVDKNSLVGGSGAFVNARIETDLPAGVGGIQYIITDDVSSISTIASIYVPSGSRFSPWFVVNASSVSSQQNGTLKATQYGAGGVLEAFKSQTISVLPNGVKSLTFNPSTVVGGQPTSATITLFGPAPYASYPIPLSEDSAYVSGTTTVYFPSGATSITIPINTTLPPTDVVVPIKAGGAVSVTSNLTVKQNGIISVTASPTSIRSGQTSLITVTLAKAAPTGGATCTVSIPGASVISGPTSVVIPAGLTSARFSVTGKTVTTPTDGFVTVSYLTTSKVVTVRVSPS